jgi:hypothetical protein
MRKPPVECKPLGLILQAKDDSIPSLFADFYKADNMVIYFALITILFPVCPGNLFFFSPLPQYLYLLECP